MRTEKEILERQQQFCDAYSFPKDYPPKMKAWDSAVNVSVKTRGYPVYSDKKEKRKEAIAFWKIQLEMIGEK